MPEHPFSVAAAAHAPWLPHVPHAPTEALRVARARERFFGEGLRPTGLVSEAVLQSWMRCTAQGQRYSEDLSFESVSALRLDTALRRSRPLLEAAQGPLRELEGSLGSTGCHVLLVNPQGLVVHASPSHAALDEGLMRRVARPGVDLSEHLAGTNAPAVVLKTGRACRIGGGEHFFEQTGAMHCAAAPIRDLHGRLAGVLNLVLERQPFSFDAELLVGLQAAAIERQLMLLQSTQHTLVEIHVLADSLGRPGAGLIGLDEEGRLAWCNAQARQFIPAAERSDCEEVLGLKLSALWHSAAQPYPTLLTLPSGLCVWARLRLPLDLAVSPPAAIQAEMAVQAEGGDSRPSSAQEPSPAVPPSLLAHERELLNRTLQACDGNISETARRLGISRGRIYRHLAQVQDAGPVKGHPGR